MPVAPNPDNYTLGRGIIYFDKKVSTGVYEGERDLGNAQSFSISISQDKLDHFNTRSGLKAKDKVVIMQITPTFSLVIDEPNIENLAMLFLGAVTSVSQVADADGIAVSFTDVQLDRFYQVGNYRDIAGAVTYLPYDTGTVIFVIGEVVSGATGIGTVVEVYGDSTAGVLVIHTVTPGFVAAEAITGSGSGAASVAAGETESTTAAAVPFVCSQDGLTIYTVTTDFTVDADSGRIFIVNGGAILADDDIGVVFTVGTLSYTTISAFDETSIEGHLRYVPDNPVGTNVELYIPRADLSPTGDFQTIADDWQVMEFVGEILKDESVNEPYIKMISADTL